MQPLLLSGKITVIFYSYFSMRFTVSQPGPNSNASEDSQVTLNDILPNEVQRQMLLHFSPMHRKAVVRTQKLWRFLDASVTPEEQTTSPIEHQLLVAAVEGKAEVLKSLLPSFVEEIKVPKAINSWLWLALRLAAKNGHLECMKLLSNEYLFEAFFLFPHIAFRKHINHFLNEEQQRISKNIDAMPGLEQEEIVKSLALNPINATFTVPALQVFIANDQVKCMESILRTPGFSLPHPGCFQPNFLIFMAQHNRPQCLDLFLREHSNDFLTTLTKGALSELNQLSKLAIENGHLESLKVLLLAIREKYGEAIFTIAKIAATNEANRTSDHKEACLELIKSIAPSNENQSNNNSSRRWCTLS